MTVHHFIAADKELPVGNFGVIGGDLVTIVKLETYHEPIKKHFNKKFVYEMDGYLGRPGKSIKILFNYINRNL